jgi:excisionase family DNA binding protein
MEKEVYTVDQIAKILQVNPMTIRKLIKAGKLKTLRVGRLIRVTREALEEYKKLD